MIRVHTANDWQAVVCFSNINEMMPAFRKLESLIPEKFRSLKKYRRSVILVPRPDCDKGHVEDCHYYIGVQWKKETVA